MKVNLKAPFGFILKKDLVEFDVEEQRGARVIRAGKYKQIIKESEYQQIMDSRVFDPSEIPMLVTPHKETLVKVETNKRGAKSRVKGA